MVFIKKNSRHQMNPDAAFDFKLQPLPKNLNGGDVLDYVVRDTAFTARAPINPARNLAIDSIKEKLQHQVGVCPSVNLTTRKSLLSRGAVASVHRKHGKPLHQIVHNQVSAEAAEPYVEELTSRAHFHTHLDTVNYLWENSNTSEIFEKEYQKHLERPTTSGFNLPALDPIIEEPNHLQLPNIVVMSDHVTPSAPIEVESDDDRLSIHANDLVASLEAPMYVELPVVMVSAPPTIEPIRVSAPPSISTRYGMKRGDRSEPEDIIEEDPQPSTSSAAAVRTQKKKKKTLHPPTGVGIPPGFSEEERSSSGLERMMLEQIDILANLTTQVSQLTNGLSAAVDDIRSVKDILAKQSQLLVDQNMTIESLKNVVSGLTLPETTPEPSTAPLSTVQTSIGKAELASREKVRDYYQQKIKPFQLTHLTEPLMVDMWSATPSSRKALFLARHPGIEWTDAMAQVVAGVTELSDVVLRQADAEMAAYLISVRNKPTPVRATIPTTIKRSNVVVGLKTPVPSSSSQLEQFKASGQPIFSLRARFQK